MALPEHELERLKNRIVPADLFHDDDHDDNSQEPPINISLLEQYLTRINLELERLWPNRRSRERYNHANPYYPVCIRDLHIQESYHKAIREVLTAQGWNVISIKHTQDYGAHTAADTSILLFPRDLAIQRKLEQEPSIR